MRNNLDIKMMLLIFQLQNFLIQLYILYRFYKSEL